MQILTGSKRTITINEWIERMDKREKSLLDTLECVRRYTTESDIERALERVDALKTTLMHFSAALEYMNKNNIQ